MKTNREAALKWAEFALAQKQAGNRESASGRGSSLANTVDVRRFLEASIADFQVSSILDLGCGDWNWMKHVMDSPVAREVEYLGWDIHPAMIEALQRTHGSDRIRFQAVDIFAEPLAEADLVMCRDVLFHVDIGMAENLVERVMRSSARFFLSTTFPNEQANENIAMYLPIEGWGFHNINLDIAPFNLADRVIRRASEAQCSNKDKPRFVCLYRVGDSSPRADKGK